MDRRRFPGVDIVHDINDYPWPFDDGSVSEVYCSHVLEHLDHNRHNPERCRFANELYRILCPGGFAEIITPHWASARAYGDFTHADKPVSEMFFLYLSRDWRRKNAPDTDIEWNKDGLTCDFVVEWGTSLDPPIALRNQEFQQFAARYYREAAQDIVATWRKA
jgi:SAM-dependent methyltransferase